MLVYDDTIIYENGFYWILFGVTSRGKFYWCKNANIARLRNKFELTITLQR